MKSRCDKDRWLAKQWDNVCTEEISQVDLNTNQNLFSNSIEDKGIKTKSEDVSHEMPKTSDFSANNFLLSMIDEKRHGNDRYIKKIWHKFHPNEVNSPKNEVRIDLVDF